MMTPLPYSSYLEAENRAAEFERQAEVERMLGEAGAVEPMRRRLARVLTRLAERLEPELRERRRPGRA